VAPATTTTKAANNHYLSKSNLQQNQRSIGTGGRGSEAEANNDKQQDAQQQGDKP